MISFIQRQAKPTQTAVKVKRIYSYSLRHAARIQ